MAAGEPVDTFGEGNGYAVNSIHAVARQAKLVVGAMVFLYCCYGCATSTPALVHHKAAVQPVQRPASHLGASPAAAVPQPAGRILGVRVEGSNGVIQVQISGTRPFQDYVYQRLSRESFTVELAGITNATTCPGLPTHFHGLQLSYVPGKAGRGARLIGTLKGGVGHYLLKAFGNDLFLTLYQPGQAAQTAGKRFAGPSNKPAIRNLGRAAGVPVSARNWFADSSHYPRSGYENQAYKLNRGLKRKYTGKRISLNLQEADLKNVLRLLADLSGTNMVIEPGVSGKVTLKVNDVPWDQVLHLILSMNNLGEEREGNVIRIATQAEFQREWKEQEQAIQAKRKLLEMAQDVGPISTAYLSVNYASPNDIAAKLKEIASPKGKISVDSRSSLIIYSDYPARIAAARALLAKLDKPTPQVMIEARIVTVKYDSALNLGIQWTLNTSSTSLNPSFAVNEPASTTTSTSSSGGNYSSYFGLKGLIDSSMWDLDMTLSAMETADQARIVAAPQVLTLDNQKAYISQGVMIPYLVLSGQNVASTTFENATVSLQVTPHITPDHKIVLRIDAKDDEPVTSAETTYNNQANINTREVKTDLLVNNGKIVVIGGVIRSTDQKSLVGVPGLDKIPLLGRLFRNNSYSHQKSELLIFISPRIVEGSSSSQEGSNRQKSSPGGLETGFSGLN